MRVLFCNRTTTTAYIAIVNYYDTYLSDPVIFELEAGQQCFYETTPYHVFGGLVFDRCNCWDLLDWTTWKYIFPSDKYRWYSSCHVGFDVDSYLLDHPEVGPAKLSMDTNAIRLKDYMCSSLAKRYNAYNMGLDIKCPDTD
jgi:hypothetical protein